MRGAGRGAKLTEFVGTTRDLKPDDLQRLFTRDTRDAYRFFARHIDAKVLEGLSWHRRLLAHLRLFLHAFVLKLSPARRIVFGVSLFLALIGIVSLMRLPFAVEGIGRTTDPDVVLPDGAGGDFYDILPVDDRRVAIAVGDVAGKGRPAALLLAMLRTLVDERLEPADLVSRLNLQVGRHAPANRFITLFYGVYDAAAGVITYVNGGRRAAAHAGRWRIRPPARLRHGARHVWPCVLSSLTDVAVA